MLDGFGHVKRGVDIKRDDEGDPENALSEEISIFQVERGWGPCDDAWSDIGLKVDVEA